MITEDILHKVVGYDDKASTKDIVVRILINMEYNLKNKHMLVNRKNCYMHEAYCPNCPFGHGNCATITDVNTFQPFVLRYYEERYGEFDLEDELFKVLL